MKVSSRITIIIFLLLFTLSLVGCNNANERGNLYEAEANSKDSVDVRKDHRHELYPLFTLSNKLYIMVEGEPKYLGDGFIDTGFERYTVYRSNNYYMIYDKSRLLIYDIVNDDTTILENVYYFKHDKDMEKIAYRQGTDFYIKELNNLSFSDPIASNVYQCSISPDLSVLVYQSNDRSINRMTMANQVSEIIEDQYDFQVEFLGTNYAVYKAPYDDAFVYNLETRSKIGSLNGTFSEARALDGLGNAYILTLDAKLYRLLNDQLFEVGDNFQMLFTTSLEATTADRFHYDYSVLAADMDYNYVILSPASKEIRQMNYYISSNVFASYDKRNVEIYDRSINNMISFAFNFGDINEIEVVSLKEVYLRSDKKLFYYDGEQVSLIDTEGVQIGELTQAYGDNIYAIGEKSIYAVSDGELTELYAGEIIDIPYVMQNDNTLVFTTSDKRAYHYTRDKELKLITENAENIYYNYATATVIISSDDKAFILDQDKWIEIEKNAVPY